MDLIIREAVIRDWMPAVADKYELHMLSESPASYLKKSAGGNGVCFKEYIEKKLVEAVENKPSVIVGLGAQIIFRKYPDSLNVRIIASDETRIARIRKRYRLNASEAGKLLLTMDKRHKRYISTLYNADWSDPSLYDMALNTDHLTIDECVDIIIALAEKRNLPEPPKQRLEEMSTDEGAIGLPYAAVTYTDRTSPAEPAAPPASAATTAAPDSAAAPTTPTASAAPVLTVIAAPFKHPAEEEFAGILDMYGIEWIYEPKTFPVEWDAEGNVTLAISPDFYLPSFDTYIEITTMDQKYVTTKNKKIKKLRELYPGINVNIVYKKDFNSLLKRFGIWKGPVV